MHRFDIAVIGTGPAGLSAAITAKVRNKTVLLLGNTRLSDKVEKAHTINNYLGLPGISGSDMQKAFLEHLKQMEIEITEDKVNTVYAMGEYFALQGHSASYEASSVILAPGRTVTKPYPGELENLGRGVSYCATCDAALYRGKTALVVGFSDEEEKEVTFLAQMAEKVFYLPMYDKEIDLPENVEVLRQKPVSIARENGKMRLLTEEGGIEADGIFLLREQAIPNQLVPGLEITNNCIEVDRQMRTSIGGLFACGDITGAPYQYIKAAGEGNVAALSAVSYLDGR